MKKRRRGKNYFHKETEGRRSRKPTSTDGNAVKMIFDRRTFSFFKLIDYRYRGGKMLSNEERKLLAKAHKKVYKSKELSEIFNINSVNI